MSMNIEYKIRGEFDVDIKKGRKVRRVLTACPNLITNSGMDAFGTSAINSFMAVLRVGTGNTAPAFTDTALVSQVASQGGARVGWSWDTVDTHTAVMTQTYTFATGVAAGSLAELGLSTSGAANLTTRALFLDSGGNPVTVTVLADEQLIVTYRLYVTPVETDSVFNITVQGTPYTLTMRPSNLGVSFPVASLYNDRRLTVVSNSDVGTSSAATPYYGASSGIGSVTGQPTGSTTTDAPIPSFASYTAGSHYRDATLSWGLSAANQSNIGAFLLHGIPFFWQVGVSPRFTKTNVETMSLTVRTSWARG